MSASDDPLDKALSEDVSPTEALQGGISGVILAIFGAAIFIIEEISGAIGRLFEVMSAVRDFFMAFYENPAMILEAGAEVTAGDLEDFGIAAFAVGVLAIAMGYIVWRILRPQLPLVDRYLPWRNRNS